MPKLKRQILFRFSIIENSIKIRKGKERGKMKHPVAKWDNGETIGTLLFEEI
ncbi:MAG: hypothetical protein QME90_12725 [Thermodesulfobacteriota bacterium]|nr:hypothetical protein [Thermodesulfobacteriota bacterium]